MSPHATSSTHPSPFARQLIRSYTIGYLHVRRFTEDFTDEEARLTPSGQLPLVWYIGHLLCAHDHFVDLYVGAPSTLDGSFVQSYAGSGEGTDFSLAPPLSKLLADYESMYLRVSEFLATLEPESLDRGPDGTAGHPSFGSLGSALAVVSFHDGYHAGQLARLRLDLGKSDLSADVDLIPIV